MDHLPDPGLEERLGRHKLIAVTVLLRRRASMARAACIIIVAVVASLLAGFHSRPVHAEAPFVKRTVPAAADSWVVEQSKLCGIAVQQAEQRYHLPRGLLLAIANAESGRPITSLTDVRPWPWTIDADGAGLFLDSKAAAVAWVRMQIARHSFVDVGCMQVDLEYHPNAFASLAQAFDPVANADYAARFLLELYSGEAGHSWDVAVGLYHSHTMQLAAEYRDRVAMIGSDIQHGTLTGEPLYVRAIRQGTLRLPLIGGRVALINVHRQPARRARHPYTVCQIEQILGRYLSGGQRASACAVAAQGPASLGQTALGAK